MSERILHFALTEPTHERMKSLLLRNAPAEEVCFALLAPSSGVHRRTLIVRDLIEPLPGERQVHGNVSFSARFTNRAIDAAIDAGLGLALVHSHPFGRGFQQPSPDDRRAEPRTLEPAAFALRGQPVAGMILAGDGVLSGREYRFGSPGTAPSTHENGATRIVGPHVVMQHRGEKGASAMISPSQASHVGLFGERGQGILGNLAVGIVGLGSVGSGVNLQLAQLGLGRIGGIDYDRVEPRNLNRLHARPSDARLRRMKVDVARRAALLAATAVGFRFDRHVASIVEEDGVRCALDYDVLFSCADSHWSRQVLNALAYAHLVPVIDGGTAIHAEGMLFQTASFRVQPIGPGRGCLACGGGFDPTEVGEEMAGVSAPHYAGNAAQYVGAPSVSPLNMALAGFEVLRFMEIALGIAGVRELARQRFDYRGGDVQLDMIECAKGCRWSAAEALGDLAGLPVGSDPRFERASWAARSTTPHPIATRRTAPAPNRTGSPKKEYQHENDQR